MILQSTYSLDVVDLSAMLQNLSFRTGFSTLRHPPTNGIENKEISEGTKEKLENTEQKKRHNNFIGPASSPPLIVRLRVARPDMQEKQSSCGKYEHQVGNNVETRFQSFHTI